MIINCDYSLDNKVCEQVPKESDDLLRWKGKQVRILYELVTVFREWSPKYHWETGKMDGMMICKPGDLPASSTKAIALKPRVTGCTLF